MSTPWPKSMIWAHVQKFDLDDTPITDVWELHIHGLGAERPLGFVFRKYMDPPHWFWRIEEDWFPDNPGGDFAIGREETLEEAKAGLLACVREYARPVPTVAEVRAALKAWEECAIPGFAVKLREAP